MATYPAGLKSFTQQTDSVDDADAVDINSVYDEVEAMQANVGITDSADTDSIDYKLKNAASIDPGHHHTDTAIDDVAYGKLTYSGLTVKHVLAASSATAASFRALQETDIVNGSVLARLADAESVTGLWTFNHASAPPEFRRGLALTDPGDARKVILDIDSSPDATVTYKWPTTLTASGFLQVAAGGVMSWATPASVTAPGGSDTEVQFNDSASFGADDCFTWNKTTELLTLSHKAAADDVRNQLRIQRERSSGTAAAGLGSAIEFWIEDDADAKVKAVSLVGMWADPAAATADAAMRIALCASGSVTNVLKLLGGPGQQATLKLGDNAAIDDDTYYGDSADLVIARGWNVVEAAVLDIAGLGAAGRSMLVLSHLGGTAWGSKAATPVGQIIGELGAKANWDTTAGLQGAAPAAIEFYVPNEASETWSATSWPMAIRFWTTADLANERKRRLEIMHDGYVRFWSADNSAWSEFIMPDSQQQASYSWPVNVPASNNQLLQCDTNGAMAWVDSSAATAAGSDGQIQYNDGGSMGGTAALTHDDTLNTVTVQTYLEFQADDPTDKQRLIQLTATHEGNDNIVGAGTDLISLLSTETTTLDLNYASPPVGTMPAAHAFLNLSHLWNQTDDGQPELIGMYLAADFAGFTITRPVADKHTNVLSEMQFASADYSGAEHRFYAARSIDADQRSGGIAHFYLYDCLGDPDSGDTINIRTGDFITGFHMDAATGPTSELNVKPIWVEEQTGRSYHGPALTVGAAPTTITAGDSSRKGYLDIVGSNQDPAASNTYAGQFIESADTPSDATAIKVGSRINLTGSLPGGDTETRGLWINVAGGTRDRAIYLEGGAVRLAPLASAPAGVEEGLLWPDSSANTLKYYDGTAWVDLGTSAQLSGLVAATSTNTIANGDYQQTWQWALDTANQIGLMLEATSEHTTGNGQRLLLLDRNTYKKIVPLAIMSDAPYGVSAQPLFYVDTQSAAPIQGNPAFSIDGLGHTYSFLASTQWSNAQTASYSLMGTYHMFLLSDFWASGTNSIDFVTLAIQADGGPTTSYNFNGSWTGLRVMSRNYVQSSGTNAHMMAIDAFTQTAEDGDVTLMEVVRAQLKNECEVTAGCTVATGYGFRLLAPATANGGTFTTVWGYVQEGSEANAFAGPISIGSTAAPTTDASIDLKATDKAALVNRLNDAQEGALTETDGMIIYNTTDNKFRGRANGAWVDFHA